MTFGGKEVNVLYLLKTLDMWQVIETVIFQEVKKKKKHCIVGHIYENMQ